MSPVAEAPLCPKCGLATVLRDSTVIYKRPGYGQVWVCRNFPNCDCYVGVHKGTTKPLGLPADKETRDARREAHDAFDWLWKPSCYKVLTRQEAYTWLAGEFNVPEIHIGESNKETCVRIRELSLRRRYAKTEEAI